MRIVVYPHSLDVGGSQLNAIELAAAVRDRGHDVSLFAAETGPLAETAGRLGLRLDLGSPGRMRPSVHLTRSLLALCRREHVDIVHGYEWPPCLEAFFGPFIAGGITVGCTVMSMSVAPFIPSSIPLIVGTEQIAAAAIKGRTGSVAVIEPPVNAVENHPSMDGTDFRRQYGLADSIVVVVVSRFAQALKLEGLERAIGAVAFLAKDHPVRLVLVGDGPARDQLQRAAAAVNSSVGQGTVTLTGELRDPRPAYAAADIVLGMGGSALRAMAFAKPVVVLGELGFAEVLAPQTAAIFLHQGFYGLGSGDNSPEPLAALVRPLLVEANRRIELGRFARQLLESRFSLTAAAQKQEQLYQAWVAAPQQRWAALSDAGVSASRLLAYKIRRRVDRWRTHRIDEDFNAIEKISETAALAGGRR